MEKTGYFTLLISDTFLTDRQRALRQLIPDFVRNILENGIELPPHLNHIAAHPQDDVHTGEIDVQIIDENFSETKLFHLFR